MYLSNLTLFLVSWYQRKVNGCSHCHIIGACFMCMFSRCQASVKETLVSPTVHCVTYSYMVLYWIKTNSIYCLCMAWRGERPHRPVSRVCRCVFLMQAVFLVGVDCNFRCISCVSTNALTIYILGWSLENRWRCPNYIFQVHLDNIKDACKYHVLKTKTKCWKLTWKFPRVVD